MHDIYRKCDSNVDQVAYYEKELVPLLDKLEKDDIEL